MPEFVLDTSGTVTVPCPVSWAPQAQSLVNWADLDAFTQGYIEALFFTSCDPSASMTEIGADHEFQDGSIPSDSGFSDLHPESLANIIADCAEFQRDHAAELAAVYALPPGRYSKGDTIDMRRAGQFFWYARNGHGVAWDDDFGRDEPGADVLRGLQEACRRTATRDAMWGAAADGAESPTGHGFVFVE